MKREFQFIENYRGYKINFVTMSKEQAMKNYYHLPDVVDSIKGEYHADGQSYGLVGFGYVNLRLEKLKEQIDRGITRMGGN